MVHSLEALVSLESILIWSDTQSDFRIRGCATPHQIQGLKGVTEDDATKAPGYDRLSPEAQEQVRLAFEAGKIVDKEFKGINAELAKIPKRYGGEISNATG